MAKDRVIQIGVDLDTSGMLSGINQMRKMLGDINVDSNLFKDVNKDLDKITTLITSMNSMLKNGGLSEKDIKPLLKDLDSASKIYTNLPNKIRQVAIATNNIRFPSEALDRLDEIQLEIDVLKDKAKKALGSDLQKALRNAIPTDLIDDKVLTNITKAEDKANSFVDTVKNIKDAAKDSRKELDVLVTSLSNPKAIPANASDRVRTQLMAENQSAAGFSRLLSQSLNNNTLEQDKDTLGQLYSTLGRTPKQLSDFITKIDEYVAAEKRANEIDNIRKQVLDIISNANLSAADATARITQLIQEQSTIERDAVEKSTKAKEKAANATEELADTSVQAMKATGDSVERANTHIQKQDSLLKQLASRATSLIGIGAVFNYITRGIRDAWNGIRELDKEFTQIAVVTDKTTSQLWQSFGTYSQMAQALGVATKDAVATSALYYQQGLDTADVMTLTAETIKMAQIAGMDFATATNQMTAAIRGFNLEMSDASKVNDIFSTLAANAAVSTQELSYALTKTASIAESAGMSIDTTSAFLTKMIETTREAPENIGTAMKSIVARFEELKSNPLALTVEVDGEEVVANKVEKAIALAGVRLRDETTGQFRDLDEVFLELAKSWENLDRNTQRYIATIAAGSRQQSRFIALMDGYDRTLELTEIAQDSEGQSAAQFLKTLDSLDSKLNKVQNSLEQLYQKFVDSDLFGGLLTGLNDFLQKIGEMDAGQLATFALVGVTIVNTIINSLKSGIPALTQVLSSVGTQVSTSIQDKLNKTFEGSKIGNATERFTANHVIGKVFGQKTNEQKEQARQKSGIIKVEADISDAQEKIDLLDQKIKNLKEEAANISIESDDEAEGYWGEALQDDLNSRIESIEKEKEAEQDALESLKDTQNQINTALSEQFNNIDAQAAQAAKPIREAIETNMGPAMTAAGASLAMSLVTSISTALSTGDWEQVMSAGLGTLALSLAPQLASTIVNTAATVIPVALAEGKGIGAALGVGINAGLAAAGPAIIIALIAAAIVGLVALIASVTSNLKSDSQRLDEELKELQKKQQQLKETSERAQAEYAVENTKTKQLDKLITKYDELIKKVNRTTDENEELIKVQNDLGQDFPDLLKYYDAASNAVLKQREEWQEIVKLQKESQQLLLGNAFSSELDLKLNELSVAEKTKERKQLDTRELLNNGYFRDLDKETATSQDVIKTLVDGKQGQFFTSLYQGADSTVPKIIGNTFMSGRGPDSKDFENFLKGVQGLDAQEQSQKLKEYMTSILGSGELLDEYLSGVGDNLTEFTVDLKNLDTLKDENNKYDKNIENKIKEIEEFIYNGIVKYTDTLLPSDSVFSNELKSRVAGGLSGKNQVDYLKNFKTPETGRELQEILAIAEGKDVDVTVLKSLAKNYNSDDAAIDYSKDTQLAGEVQNAISQIRQIYLQELSELEVETLNSLKEGLSEEDFKTINEGNFENLGRQQITDLKMEISNLGLDTTFIDNILKDFNNKIENSNWSASFKTFAEKFGTGLTEALINSKIGEKGLSTIENSFQGLATSKIPKIINEILSVDDWGNIQNLYALGEAYMDAGDSAEEATEAVKLLYEQFTNPFTVNLDPDMLADKFKSIATSIQDSAKNFKDLNSAIKEVKENGKLSAQTIVDIVAAGNIEYLAFDEATKAVTINTQAVEDNWKAQMQNAEGTIDLDLQRAKTAIAGLEAQREIEQKKLDILESAAKRGGQITAEEYNQLTKLDNKYAIEVVDGQLNLNYDQLQNDAIFFKDLFNNRTEMYNDLVNQAGYYGKQAWDAFLNHSQEVMKKGDYTAVSDFASKWSEATLEENKLSSKVRGSSNTAYYFDSSTLEQLTKEQRNKLELIDAEIKAWQGNVEKLEKYRNTIKQITGMSLEDYIASTADATKKANEELEDYVSTLEKYYTLQKQIEKSEKDRQKALKQYKKTGDAKYLQQYISESENTLKKKGQLAYVGRTEKDISMATAKTKLASYFTADELKQLQFDPATGLVDYDKFRETQAYKSKTQDDEQGKEIENILKDLFSDVEKYQGWIDDYDDFAISYQEELEDLKKEAEKIAKSIDRLQNINQAMESIKEVLEEAKDLNEEYFSSGGREGIGAMQYLKTQAEGINSENLAQGEYKKLQAEYAKEFTDKGFDQYIDKTSPDGKIYYKQGYAKELLAQGTAGQEQLESLQDLVGKYNELTDAVEDSEKAQRESAKAMREYARSLKKSYSDLITRVADDMAALDQKQIDEVKKKYAMIQEEDDKYLDALQKSIDKQRQLRDQAKSYDDLEKQEKRLALLERDTSGANAAEIAALKEQIKDARQNLVDTEQDNIVNNISEANTLRKDKMDEETTFLQNVMDERTYDMQYYLDKARDIVDAAINGDAGAYQQMLEIMQEAESEFYRVTREAQDEWLQSLTEDYEKSKGWVEIVSAGYDAITNETINHIKDISTTMAESDHGASELSNKIDGINKNINIIEGSDPFKILNANLDTAISKITTLQEEIANGKYDIEIPIIYKAVGDVPGGNGYPNINSPSTNSGKGYVAYKTNANGEEIITGLFSDEDKVKGATHGTGGNYKYVEDMSNYRTGSSLTNEQESSLENYGKTYGTLDWDEQKQVKGKDLGKELNSNEYYGLARNTSEPEVYGPFSSQYSYNPNSLDIDLSHAPDTLYTGKELEEKLLNYYGQFLDDKLIRLIPIKYKEGGLVNYTGPAWVDGTPSTPEAFLSAEDTRNFQELTKILQSVLNFDKAPVATSEKDKIQIKSGDTNIEIHIEVDKIDSEESMEELCDMVADRIQQSYSGGISQP